MEQNSVDIVNDDIVKNLYANRIGCYRKMVTEITPEKEKYCHP